MSWSQSQAIDSTDWYYFSKEENDKAWLVSTRMYEEKIDQTIWIVIFNRTIVAGVSKFITANSIEDAKKQAEYILIETIMTGD